jgi:hypothetical protein
MLVSVWWCIFRGIKHIVSLWIINSNVSSCGKCRRYLDVNFFILWTLLRRRCFQTVFFFSNDLTTGLVPAEFHIEQRQPANLLGKTCRTPANLHKMKIDKAFKKSTWENMTHASQSPQDRVEESTTLYLLIRRQSGCSNLRSQQCKTGCCSCQNEHQLGL